MESPQKAGPTDTSTHCMQVASQCLTPDIVVPDPVFAQTALEKELTRLSLPSNNSILVGKGSGEWAWPVDGLGDRSSATGRP